VSKTALYRYFSGKDEIVAAMEEHFFAIYEELSDRVVQERRGESIEEVFDAYNSQFVRFFAEHFNYLRFAQIHFLRKPEIENLFLTVTFSRSRELFPPDLISSRYGWRMAQVPVIVRFIFAVSNFLLVMGNCGEAEGTQDVQGLLEKNRRMVLGGVGELSRRWVPDFEAIEAECTLGPEDFPEPNRIFRAVSEVIAEDGLWNATLEKIAGKLGMSKSSLYFYFENRDQMLWELIDRERHHLGALMLDRAMKRDGFEEQLYAYFVLFLRYVWGRPEFLATMNWLRYQELAFEPPDDPVSGMVRYYRFMSEAAENGVFNPGEFPMDMVVQLMHFLLMQEITERFRLGEDIEEQLPVLRTLHQLFLYGIQGA
jgi:AcrR family transcriptional regulator